MKNDFLESIEKRISAAMEKAAEQAKPYLDRAKPVIDAAKEKAEPILDAAKEKAEPYLDRAKPVLDVAKEKAGAAAEQAKPILDAAKEKAGAAAGQAKPYIDAAKEKAEPYLDRAKPMIDAAKEKAEPILDAAKPYIDAAKEKAGAAAEQAEEIIRLTVVPESALEMAGVDSARITFTGYSEADGSERRLMIEFLAVKEKHLQITAGALEQSASRVFPWDEVSLKTDSPYQVGAGSCYLSETRTLGQVVSLGSEETKEDDLRVIWDLHMEPNQVEGRVVINGILYRVSPETCDAKLSVEGLKEIVP